MFDESCGESDFSSDDSIIDPNFELLENNCLFGQSDADAIPTCSITSHLKKPWSRNLKKQLRQSGAGYVNSKNQEMPPRKILSSCKVSCCFKCNNNFNYDDRSKIFKDFWKLNDDDKVKFYFKFVRTQPIKRRRCSGALKKRISYTYRFQVDSRIHRVCRLFFLNTLNIDKKRIYYAFENHQNIDTGVPKPNTRGRHVKKVTSDYQLSTVREHIESFKKIESHYCRSNTTRSYIEADLNLSKMYRLYIEKCETPVKKGIYEKVFRTEFNISFHKPKKDICDKCYKHQNNEFLNESDRLKHMAHIKEKELCKIERDTDRNNIDSKNGIICYDLQKVFGLPRGNYTLHFETEVCLT